MGAVASRRLIRFAGAEGRCRGWALLHLHLQAVLGRTGPTVVFPRRGARHKGPAEGPAQTGPLTALQAGASGPVPSLSEAAGDCLRDLQATCVHVCHAYESDAPVHCGVGVAQEANEKSFALLQEYLQLARSDAQAAGPARGFRFDFYLQRVSWQDDAVGQAAESTSGDQADVQRVQLMLPPPGRRSPAQQQAGE